MTQIKIKPLSVNNAWQGRRTKTQDYRYYEKLLWYKLPNKIEIPEGMLFVYLEWGFSSRASDWDNPIKPFVDILQKKYGFNDNRIESGFVHKEHVKKGSEYLIFKILPSQGIKEIFVSSISQQSCHHRQLQQ